LITRILGKKDTFFLFKFNEANKNKYLVIKITHSNFIKQKLFFLFDFIFKNFINKLEENLKKMNNLLENVVEGFIEKEIGGNFEMKNFFYLRTIKKHFNLK